MDESTRHTAGLMALLITALLLACAAKVELHQDAANHGNRALMTLAAPVPAAMSQASSVPLGQVLRLIPQDRPPAGCLGDLYVDRGGQLHFHDGRHWCRVRLAALADANDAASSAP